ncbi:glycosyl transferase family group 2-domain-containing protein [Crepidotus variabilis]|uniref:Glycosyl transferase family group 2-domain-containing protein n=1 Tax=Crepidotus variabilis TaxID=179855 RepID=A0A9P6E9I0_9AGAR|nr:glycosyl transferase family group 2-domain-containing protein [Crepidotus variabilis]
MDGTSHEVSLAFKLVYEERISIRSTLMIDFDESSRVESVIGRSSVELSNICSCSRSRPSYAYAYALERRREGEGTWTWDLGTLIPRYFGPQRSSWCLCLRLVLRWSLDFLDVEGTTSGPEERSVYVDAETRIQIIPTMLMLPQADREQGAAFIRDERVLIIWSESLDRIVPLCQDIEERLIKLLWRSRPSHAAASAASGTVSANGSVADHSSGEAIMFGGGRKGGSRPNSMRGGTGANTPIITPGGIVKGMYGEQGRDWDADELDDEKFKPLEKGLPNDPHGGVNGGVGGVGGRRFKRTWYGKKVPLPSMDTELGALGYVQNTDDETIHPRPTPLYSPLYNGLAAGMAVVFIGNGVKTLLLEWRLDGVLDKMADGFAWMQFFCLQIVQNITMSIGPIAHYHSNSKYYSALAPQPNKIVDNALPHITIQMPVYKESLETVLAPSIRSLKKAMQTYARQGGTSTIFVCDDGLRLLPAPDRDERLAFYANHNIGWVARPKHDNSPDGYKRAGRFKKASNMNYGLELSLKMEQHLEKLLIEQKEKEIAGQRISTSDSTHPTRPFANGANARFPDAPNANQYGIQYQHRDGDESVVWGHGVSSNPSGPSPPHNHNTFPPTAFAPPSLSDDDLEERALSLAIEDMFQATGMRAGQRPWAANGRSIRVGEIVLLVDSDTVVPEDCLRDAAREMRASPTVGVIQHESEVLKVAGHYFENGIAYFTRRINRCIGISCANGEVAPFVGHNAFLRWKAIQDAAFIDPADGKEKIWSENNVSEDFDMALRLTTSSTLRLNGYYDIRWATYSHGGFKEGVSLSVDDELNRWQKYAYGCNELLFHPFAQWWRRGPITKKIHTFLWSKAPLHYKISMMSYMFSYYGIAAAMTIAIINYILLGFQFPVDGYFMHSFEIFLATTVVFFGSGTVGYTLLEYRLGYKKLVKAFLENLMWLPFFFFFFGGLSIPVSQAILAHLFSYNITWSATVKELQRSNFFKEIPKIIKRFWFPLLFSFIVLAGMIIVATPLVPVGWRVDGTAWAVIFPLSLSAACHILFPIVLNPWLMVFSY